MAPSLLEILNCPRLRVSSWSERASRLLSCPLVSQLAKFLARPSAVRILRLIKNVRLRLTPNVGPCTSQ